MKDRLREDIAKKIETFRESGMLFWCLTVTLTNGSKVCGVICGHNGTEYDFLSQNGPLQKADIIDVAWEGLGRPDWAK
jgi:hypothetical protein